MSKTSVIIKMSVTEFTKKCLIVNEYYQANRHNEKSCFYFLFFVINFFRKNSLIGMS